MDGSMMLRFRQMGMTFMAVTLVSTCVCQPVGNALGSFILSISRQGVLYVFSLFVMSHLLGYTGVLVRNNSKIVGSSLCLTCMCRALLKTGVSC